MTLVLQGLSLDDEPLSKPLVGRFDERGGDIGRSDNVTFTLPDPERMISRVHARISYAQQTYWIENVSAKGTILHNGRPLSSAMRVRLNEGDELRIGGYRLSVDFESDVTSATILRGRTTLQLAGNWENVKEPPASKTPEPPPSVASPAAVVTPEAATPALAAGPAPVVRPSPAARGGRAARTRSAAESAAAVEALWRSFQDGLGVELAPSNAPSPEFFAALGAMLRIAVNGIHGMVAARAATKSQLNAEPTMIQAHGNNPLKFSPDAAIALKMLLQPPMPGFLSGEAALREALIDLQSHQVGVLAGMRAALETLLDRFDPLQLESQLSSRSFIDTVMPSHLRARLWEMYIAHFQALKQDAHEDFDRLFGEAFLEAYNAQVRRLQSVDDETGRWLLSDPTDPKVG
ncbi:MAG TPA: type VI secretion system-associated FHA domain protein TagH [Burkholderiaceae bacterium]|nr:type VI secretion system-associated FHA domain protein TagH [Burkholderiaceae bacterium]